MKIFKNYFLYFLLLISGVVSAQYEFIDLHNFNGTGGANPYGSLLRNGNALYGLTEKGGIHNRGCVFSVDTNGNGFKDLLDFNGSNGSNPYGSLICLGKKLYGMTTYGGISGDGNIFSIDTNGVNYRDLLDFNMTNGAYPFGSLLLSDSVLYGMTSTGGPGYGNIFCIDTNGSGFRVLLNFIGANGFLPYGSLIISGNILYGMASEGGAHNYGCVFSLNKNGTGYKDLLDFNQTNGSYPEGSLVLVGNRVYGMTTNGGSINYGTIFCIDTNGSGYKHLHDFMYSTGLFPVYSNLNFLNGNLYGMTNAGGKNNTGTVFSIDTNGSAYQDIYDFSVANGDYPYGSLSFSGNWMYGMTELGGSVNYGVIFSFRTCSTSASSLINTNVSCFGDSDGSATIIPTSGIAPFSYMWSTNPAQTSAQATGLKAGSYSVIVYDSTGCTTTLKITITQPASLKDSMLSTCATCCNCAGTAIDFTYGGTQPYTFLWSNGATTDTIKSLSGGSYTCTVTDANGCIKTDTVWVHNGNHVITSQTDITCNGLNNGTASVSIFGNYSYSWSPGGATTSSISGLSAGSYTVSISSIDTIGCSSSYIFTISEPPAFTISASLISNVKCYGVGDGSASSIASGGSLPYTYYWSDGESTANASKLLTGIAIINAKDKNGCTATASVVLTQPTILIANLSISTLGPCDTYPSVIANVSGGTQPYSYYWTDYGGTNSYEDVDVTCPNGYSAESVAVTDNNGCTANNFVLLNQPVQYINPYPTYTNISCNAGSNGSITLGVCSNISSNYTYFWNSSRFNTYINPYTINNLSAGTYKIYVTDLNGCSTSQEFITITQPPAIKIITDSINDNGSCNGSTWAIITGGTKPYSYIWTGGLTTDTIKNQCAGNYCCRVTDANGCIDSVCVTISLSTSLSKALFKLGNIGVFPNPNNGTFNFSNITEKSTVEVYNILGEKVKVATLNPPVGGHSSNLIDLTNQPNGIYFYRVLTDSGALAGEGKIIIQK